MRVHLVIEREQGAANVAAWTAQQIEVNPSRYADELQSHKEEARERSHTSYEWGVVVLDVSEEDIQAAFARACPEVYSP